MNLHDLQVPEEGAFANPRLPYGAGGPIDTEQYMTPEIPEQMYRFYGPDIGRLQRTYYVPNGTLGVDEPTYTYRLTGDTTWRLPERAEGVFLNEQT